MRFGSPLEAGKHAERRKESVAQNRTTQDADAESELIPRNSHVYREIFETQKEIEDAGDMDYHKYAQLLWGRVAKTPADTESEAFRTFEANLITGLHEIPMRDIVYPDVIESIPGLISKYKDSIAYVSIWSKGDVTATGYQVAKIRSSRIAERFMREIAEQIPPEARRGFFEKTSYDVADDKLENIAQYAKGRIDDGPMKITIIEDSFGNFDKARKAIETAVGPERAQQVSIHKIWALYSREGIEAKRNAQYKDGARAEFERKTKEVKAIESFSELLDEKFKDDFESAAVFVDFDGVIGDNLILRDRQAGATLRALVDGFSNEWAMGRHETKERIFTELAKKE